MNLQNKAGSTPFFLSTEGLHRQLSQVVFVVCLSALSTNHLLCACLCLFLHLKSVCLSPSFLVQLLVEWGADINIKNRISKTAMDLIRNLDMKEFLQSQLRSFSMTLLTSSTMLLTCPI